MNKTRLTATATEGLSKMIQGDQGLYRDCHNYQDCLLLYPCTINADFCESGG